MALVEKELRPVDALIPGRREALQAARCMRKPMGCGEKVTTFRDPLSMKEYGISGLCQACQDRIFGV